jgi:hypothetical protein
VFVSFACLGEDPDFVSASQVDPRGSSTTTRDRASRVEVMRSLFGASSLVDVVKNLVEANWAPKTRKRLSSVWRIWSSFCLAFGLRPQDTPSLESVRLWVVSLLMKGLKPGLIQRSVPTCPLFGPCSRPTIWVSPLPVV